MDETDDSYNVHKGGAMVGRRERERLGRPRRARSAAPRVHGRGEARLDAMLELAEEASRDAALAEVLSSLCERIAKMLAVDVCSIYLREVPSDAQRRHGELVLRATWGYPQSAVGAVRMRVGEGLTGFAVECLRPVSVAHARADARNKAFEGLDEDRFPSLCALPLVDGGRAVGALVIQRRQPRRFGQREIVLAAAVASPVLFALERARMRERDAADAAVAPPRTSPRPHEVVLRGRGAAPGQALGTVMVRRHAAAQVDRRESARGDIADERARLGQALAAAADEVAELEQWALRNAPLDRGTMFGLLSPARFVLDDARLRGRMVKQVEAGGTAEEAVERVMREYTRILSSSGDQLLVERALEVEALCLRVMARLHGPKPSIPPGCVLVASRLTVADALELGAAHGVAVVLAASAEGSPGVAVACALGLPVVASVNELFRWAADGDRALINGEEGTVILNPSRVDVAAHRRR
jgi:phosphotransferase system enzyme I (PtsP)